MNSVAQAIQLKTAPANAGGKNGLAFQSPLQFKKENDTSLIPAFTSQREETFGSVNQLKTDSGHGIACNCPACIPAAQLMKKPESESSGITAESSAAFSTVQLKFNPSPPDTNSGCPCCGGVSQLMQQQNDGAVAQLLTVTNNNMQAVSARIAGENSRSTVAIAKTDDTHYYVYSQRHLMVMDDIIDEYDNLFIGQLGTNQAGLHAEMLALAQGGTNFYRIAASQGICERCARVMREYDVIRVNYGGQFTKQWEAPFYEEIDETNDYPANASNDNQRNGTSGTRYGMDNQDRYYPIAKSTWDQHHDTW